MTNIDELANKLEYCPKDKKYLKKALRTVVIKEPNQGDNNTTYSNHSLATLGDAVLKSVLAHIFYLENDSRQYISESKADIENNNVLYRFCHDNGIYRYAYNDKFCFDDAPGHEKLPHGSPDFYVEAIIGAIYLDLGYNETFEWIQNHLKPRLDEIAKVMKNTKGDTRENKI